MRRESPIAPAERYPPNQTQRELPGALLDEAAKGVFVIAATPFRDDGALDLASNYVLAKRGGPLSAADIADVERLIARQTERLDEIGASASVDK